MKWVTARQAEDAGLATPKELSSKKAKGKVDWAEIDGRVVYSVASLTGAKRKPFPSPPAKLEDHHSLLKYARRVMVWLRTADLSERDRVYASIAWTNNVSTILRQHKHEEWARELETEFVERMQELESLYGDAEEA